ncbi:hypothetical protein DFS33DRAFT_374879 [Desarmillaria ectypa]|nr:hypothetical protein DFS33DRAFT_374879 [Desarmillaria ectypa]
MFWDYRLSSFTLDLCIFFFLDPISPAYLTQDCLYDGRASSLLLFACSFCRRGVTFFYDRYYYCTYSFPDMQRSVYLTIC